jgi:hypothetical protein
MRKILLELARLGGPSLADQIIQARAKAMG